MEQKGVAIQSRVRKLKDALRAEDGYIIGEDSISEEVPRSKIFTPGAVRYIDYDEQLTPETNNLAPLFLNGYLTNMNRSSG